MTERGEPLLARVAWLSFAAAIAAYMLLSGPALLKLGIPYLSAAAPTAAKFHPGSYCLVLACSLAVLAHGNPLRVAAVQARAQPLLAAYAVCLVLVTAWTVFRYGVGSAGFIIESLVMPCIAALTVLLLDAVRRPSRRPAVLQWMMLLLAANALVSVGEAWTRTAVFPLLDANGEPYKELYFRATAFFGHPLHNALITVSLFPAVVLLPWPVLWRFALAALLILSTLTFGGRASVGLGLAIYGTAAIVHFFRSAARGHYSYLQLTGGSLALMLATTALAGVAVSTGMGDRIFENMFIDSSGLVRVQAWEVFRYVSVEELWFGISPADIARVSLRAGLDPTGEAIENYWVQLALRFGIVGFVPFVLAIGCLMRFLWKNSAPALRAAIVLYLLSSSTANTLATKTQSLTLLTVAALCSTAARSGNRTPVAAAQSTLHGGPAPWPGMVGDTR